METGKRPHGGIEATGRFMLSPGCQLPQEISSRRFDARQYLLIGQRCIQEFAARGHAAAWSANMAAHAADVPGLASRIVDMLLYDVPNLRLETVRVDVYSTFAAEDEAPVQRPILTTTAGRPEADAMTWEAMTPSEILGRFETRYLRTPSGQAAPIDLPPVEGEPPMPGPRPEMTE